MPWGEWLSLIKPCYYKGERGNKPYDLELMLRIYLIQNLYDLTYEEKLAYDEETARISAGGYVTDIGLTWDDILDL